MSEEGVRHIEPRWPAALALLSIGALYYALPSALTVGPDWLVLVLVAALNQQTGSSMTRAEGSRVNLEPRGYQVGKSAACPGARQGLIRPERTANHTSPAVECTLSFFITRSR